jgi:hypothetical protein
VRKPYARAKGPGVARYCAATGPEHDWADMVGLPKWLGPELRNVGGLRDLVSVVTHHVPIAFGRWAPRLRSATASLWAARRTR